MKRILFFINQIPPYRIPFFNQLIENLKTQYKIDFIVTHEQNIPKEFKGEILKTIIIGHGKYRILPFSWKFINRYELIITLPIDPLHLLDNLIIFLTCLFLKKPYIVWTIRWEYKHLPLKDKVSLIFYKKILKKAKAIIIPGKKSYEWLEKIGIEKQKIFFAPNVSLKFPEEKHIKKLKSKIIKKYRLKEKKIILFVGRLIKRKGITFLIDAFSKISEKNLVLMIVGGKDFYKLGEKDILTEIKEKIRKNNLKNIFLIGKVQNKDLPAYYEIADVFVMPSITEKISEPWGLVLNEAMQFGLPVIATDAVGAAYDLIKPGINGYIVKEKDANALAEAIKKIIKSKKKEKMGEISKRIILKGYTYKHMVNGFIKAIKFVFEEE